MKRIRKKVGTGRPLRTNDFIDRSEGQLEGIFKIKPKERPKKKVK